MKINFLKSLILTLSLLAGYGSFSQGTAYLQIINTTADPSLDTIDIYINGNVYDTTNVVFHSVIGFYSITPDTNITLTIAHHHSTSSANGIKSFYLGSLTDNKSYALMLAGVNTTGFEPNPNGRDTSFTLYEISQIDSTSPDTAALDFKFFQGSTDLPSMKIVERTSHQLIVPDVLYGDTTPYIQLHHRLYEFQLISSDSTQNFGTYIADLSNYAGQVGIIFTAGFLNPLQNDSGPSLGLYMALSGGTVVQFTLETSAFQLIHNCADTAADSVDVYLNGEMIYQNFAFRNATPALILFAHAPYDIALAHKNSTSVNDTFWHNRFVFQPDTFYIATMSGLINPGNYAANPDGKNTSFDVLMKTPAQYTSSSNVNFDFFLIHGATDAPAVDLTPEGGPTVITGAHYGDETNYISFPPDFYTFNLNDTTGNFLGGYFANFPAYAGQSGVLLVSGFLNPAANNNGPGLGLYMVPIAGGPFVPLFLTTGINHVSENKKVEIFPNPATNQLFIHLNVSGTKNASLAITNLTGQTVASLLNNASITGEHILAADVSNLSAGLYFLRLTTYDGVSNYKFVIARGF